LDFAVNRMRDETTDKDVLLLAMTQLANFRFFGTINVNGGGVEGATFSAAPATVVRFPSAILGNAKGFWFGIALPSIEYSTADKESLSFGSSFASPVWNITSHHSFGLAILFDKIWAFKDFLTRLGADTITATTRVAVQSTIAFKGNCHRHFLSRKGIGYSAAYYVGVGVAWVIIKLKSNVLN
jgi:hypothetical protein